MLVLIMGMFLISSLQPMIMITVMIMIVLMYSYFVYMSTMGYWFSYVLLMVMLSGVLVIFTYMISLIPNEVFENNNILYMFMFLIGSILSYEYFLKEMSELISLMIWVSCYGMLNIFMVSFLFMMMLIIVWFSYINDGAIRVTYKCAWLKGLIW